MDTYLSYQLSVNEAMLEAAVDETCEGILYGIDQTDELKQHVTRCLRAKLKDFDPRLEITLFAFLKTWAAEFVMAYLCDPRNQNKPLDEPALIGEF
jgi:hypothetical protein